MLTWLGSKDVFVFSMAGAAFTVLLALVIFLKKVPSHVYRELEVM
jgi:hypothetical protein